VKRQLLIFYAYFITIHFLAFSCLFSPIQFTDTVIPVNGFWWNLSRQYLLRLERKVLHPNRNINILYTWTYFILKSLTYFLLFIRKLWAHSVIMFVSMILCAFLPKCHQLIWWLIFTKLRISIILLKTGILFCTFNFLLCMMLMWLQHRRLRCERR